MPARPEPLREGKGTNFEGGFRVPCLMRWPGKIPAGHRLWRSGRDDRSAADVRRAERGAAAARKSIDGQDIRDLMFGTPGAQSPHEFFYHYDGGNRLVALRSGRWKLMFPQTYSSPIPGSGGLPGQGQRRELELSLFDLEADIGETTNVAAQHPEVVARLEAAAEQMRQQLGDGNQQVGTARRPLGK